MSIDGDRRFLFLLGSSRLDGNTETLACRAAAALPRDVEQRWIRLDDVVLPAFEDRRHPRGKQRPQPTGPESMLLNATLHATDIVLATPLYWYSVSASTKLYLDYWSGWLELPGVQFKRRMSAKTLWGISVRGDREPEVMEPLEGMLQLSADYLSMRWGGLLRGNGSAPGQVLNDAEALACATEFFATEPALASA
jgi:multimeric flavodoxin WrbA